jgi:hypothetical protein
MAVSITPPVVPEPPEMVLIFRNERPIPIVDLGELFTSLAKDYGRLNKGRILVVSRLETGSVIAHLQEFYNAAVPYVQDSLEYLKAANNLRKFVKTLRGFIGRAKEHPQKSDLFQKKRKPGVISAEKILRIAIDAGGEVEVHQKLPDGEEIEIKVTSLEAVQIREQAKATQYKLPLTPDQKSITSARAIVQSEQIPTLQRADYLAKSLVSAARSDSAAIRALVEIIASTLRSSGMVYILEEVASKLDAGGHHELAAEVRASGYKTQRSSEPPLLT